MNDQVHDPRRLQALARLQLLDSGAEESFDRLARLAQRLLNVPVALVSLVDRDRQFFKSAAGLTGPVAAARLTPWSHSFCQQVVNSGEPLVVNDAPQHPIVRDNPAIRDSGFMSYLGFPLLSPDKFVLGAFCAIDTKPRPWAGPEIETMRELTALVISQITAHQATLHQHGDDERLRKIAFQLPGMIYQYRLRPDGTSHFPYTSEAVRRIYRLSPQEVSEDAGKVFALLHPEDHAAVVDSIQVSARTLQAWHHEYRVRFGTDDERWLLGHAVPEREPDGGVLWHGYITDITEKRGTEAALRESEARYERAARGTKDGLWEWNLVTGENYRSPRWLEMLGYAQDEQPGTFGGFSELVHPDDYARILSASEQSQLSGDYFEAEMRLRRKDGGYLWVLSRARIERDVTGKPMRMTGSISDITRRLQAEAERQQFERKIQETQKLESLGVLAGGIAHDFNNLLTGIMGNASLASYDLPVGSPLLDNLAAITEGSRRAADLCRQMLAYSGKGRFVVRNLSLNRLVEETTQLLKISISKQAVLRFNLHAGLPPIEADATQIRQVIMNLVINASEAVGGKSGVISLNTGLTRVDRDYQRGTILAPELPEGTYVYLEVSDSGCGMSPETKSRIFDPFFTTKFAGRGLGLAAVLGIVRGHRGTLKVYSELGRGTTFKLLFPCAAGAEDAVVPEAALPAWNGHGCVLVVDDEESVRSTAALMLRKLGLEVALAVDGREALRMFQTEPDRFAAVLMDLTMPHVDGRAAFAELRRIRPAVKVILMSGFNEQEAIEQFTGKGLASFLQKPFSFEALSDTVRRVLSDLPAKH